MRPVLAAALALAACKDAKPKASMTPTQVIAALEDFADRGCACGADKECFRAVRDEWDAAKPALVANAALLTGDDKTAWDNVHMKFALCGEGAGLAVFDRW
jgi:hypothetical protein